MNSYHPTVQFIVYLLLAVRALVTLQDVKQWVIVSAQTAKQGCFLQLNGGRVENSRKEFILEFLEFVTWIKRPAVSRSHDVTGVRLPIKAKMINSLVNNLGFFGIFRSDRTRDHRQQKCKKYRREPVGDDQSGDRRVRGEFCFHSNCVWNDFIDS